MKKLLAAPLCFALPLAAFAGNQLTSSAGQQEVIDQNYPSASAPIATPTYSPCPTGQSRVLTAYGSYCKCTACAPVLDPEVVYKAFVRLQPPKSPFETTSEYQRRQAMSFDILPGVSTSSPLPFALNDPSARVPLPAIHLRYDADSAAFSIEIAPLQRQFLRTGLKQFDTLTLETKSTVAGHYTGQNAFGATADVTSAFGDDYGIAFDRDSWLTRNSGLTLPVARNQAQQTYSHLRIVLLCKVTAPWVLDRTEQANPTLDNPTDYTWTEHFIFVEPQELQLYDADSGQLLKSFTPASIITEHKQMFPLHLEVETNKYLSDFLYYQVDDGPQRYTRTSTIPKPFLAADAKSRIIVSGSNKQFLSKLVFRINGQIVRPNWYSDRRFYLGQSISNYSAVLQLP